MSWSPQPLSVCSIRHSVPSSVGLTLVPLHCCLVIVGWSSTSSSGMGGEIRQFRESVLRRPQHPYDHLGTPQLSYFSCSVARPFSYCCPFALPVPCTHALACSYGLCSRSSSSSCSSCTFADSSSGCSGSYNDAIKQAPASFANRDVRQ